MSRKERRKKEKNLTLVWMVGQRTCCVRTCCEWMRMCWRAGVDVLRVDADEQKGKKKKKLTLVRTCCVRTRWRVCCVRMRISRMEKRKKKKKKKKLTSVQTCCVQTCWRVDTDVLRADADEQKGKKEKKEADKQKGKKKEEKETYFSADVLACVVCGCGLACGCGWR